MTRIALISATPAAIPPAVEGLARAFPEAEPWNLLDDKLLADAASGLTAGLRERMSRLIHHAVAAGADGVLLTCSLYGSVTRDIEADIPILAPDEAAFAAVAGYRNVLVAASLEAALTDSLARLQAALAEPIWRAVKGSAVEGVVCPGAFEAANNGDNPALLRALRHACAGSEADAVLLAQYSLAPVAEELARALGKPVVSGPHTAAALLRSILLYGGPNR